MSRFLKNLIDDRENIAALFSAKSVFTPGRFSVRKVKNPISKWHIDNYEMNYGPRSLTKHVTSDDEYEVTTTVYFALDEKKRLHPFANSEMKPALVISEEKYNKKLFTSKNVSTSYFCHHGYCYGSINEVINVDVDLSYTANYKVKFMNEEDFTVRAEYDDISLTNAEMDERKSDHSGAALLQRLWNRHARKINVNPNKIELSNSKIYRALPDQSWKKIIINDE